MTILCLRLIVKCECETKTLKSEIFSNVSAGFVVVIVMCHSKTWVLITEHMYVAVWCLVYQAMRGILFWYFMIKMVNFWNWIFNIFQAVLCQILKMMLKALKFFIWTLMDLLKLQINLLGRLFFIFLLQRQITIILNEIPSIRLIYLTRQKLLSTEFSFIWFYFTENS